MQSLVNASGLHVDDTGDGDPVVMVHSSGSSGRQWKRLATELVARGKRTVVPDLTGHGRSEPWPEPQPFDFHLDVERVGALLESLGSAHLIGHSYGGLVALHAAIAAPGRIRTLQLFDPVAFGVLDPVADRDVLGLIRNLDLETWEPTDDGRSAWFRRFVDYWSGTGAWDALPAAARAEFVRVAWVVREGVRSLMADHTSLDAYRVLACPVSILTGQTTPPTARRVDEYLAGATHGSLQVITGAGHFAPVTAAGAVNPLLIAAIEARR